MKTYKVNECYSGLKSRGFGLFDGGQFNGKGNFCGWYSYECYKNVDLIALKPTKKSEDVTIVNEHCDEIQIDTCYWTKYIEAETVEEAIKKFKKGDWRN